MVAHEVPALLALFCKGLLLIYALRANTKNHLTRVFLGFLIVLSLHNLVEVVGILDHNKNGFTGTTVKYGYAYFATFIPFLALLLHLSLLLSVDVWRISKQVLWLLYVPTVALEILLLGTNQLVQGFRPFDYSVIRVPGPLYYFFEAYAVTYLFAALSYLVYGARPARPAMQRTRNRWWLLGLSPMILLIVYLIVSRHFGWPRVPSTFYVPIAVTMLLVVTTYATYQYRLFEIELYIPWSRTRRRKTAFYDRIRSMIAEIADLQTASMERAVYRLADTLKCSVALVGGPKPALVTVSGSRPIDAVPVEALRNIDHIVVANEVSETDPKTHSLMKQHGVAAIVPFHPHSQSAAGWLLLGDSFSEQVYTPLDFRMVEKLFDRMADLFLDKLLTMRTQLADAHSQIQVLEFRLKGAETNAAALEQKVELLSRDNTRLLREQPADSLLAQQCADTTDITITLLGRDKTMLKQLRERFPQLEQYAGPESSSFRRRPVPAVLLCQVEADTVGLQRKLFELLTESAHESAVLLFGGGAAPFAFEHRQALRGKLVEVLPDQITAEALGRKVEALVQLHAALTTMAQTDVPLLGSSAVFEQAIGEATRIAGFSDPVCIETVDLGEAAAVANYMHHRARSTGSFRVLQTARLAKHESRDDTVAGMAELDKILTEVTGGTLMIDNLGALSNEIWDHILLRTDEFVNTRLIAACPPSSTRSPAVLFKPLQPLVLRMPSLRERRADLPLLIHYYTLQFNLQAASFGYLSQRDIDDLMVCNYPTNLAALRSAVFGALRAKPGRQQQPPEIPELQIADTEKSLEAYVAEFEANLIAQTLERCGGNKSKAARVLNMRPNTLHYKLERYGLLKGKA